MTDRLTDFAIPARDRIPGVAWHHALLDDTVKRSDLLMTILSSGTINFSDHRITGGAIAEDMVRDLETHVLPTREVRYTCLGPQGKTVGVV